MGYGLPIAFFGLNYLLGQKQYKADKKAASEMERRAQVNADLRKEKGRRLKGEQRARYGASGVKESGSVEDVLQQTEQDTEMDAMNIIYNGKMDALMKKRQAKLNRFGSLLGAAAQSADMASSNSSYNGDTSGDPNSSDFMGPRRR